MAVTWGVRFAVAKLESGSVSESQTALSDHAASVTLCGLASREQASRGSEWSPTTSSNAGTQTCLWLAGRRGQPRYVHLN